ncbi:MAG: sugar kinase [Clostridiales bacterium]|nr:sugar kinase [Clostridiales bacterium]
MPRIITFGEILLRLSPAGYTRLVQAEAFDAVYGGAEANAAVSLCAFGMEAAHVTALPDHAVGQAAVNALRRYGVDTSFIRRQGRRIGIYYLEKGAAARPAQVLYDRAGSSMAEAEPGDFDWPAVFAGADWFHFSGVTPALSQNAAALCLEACQAAKAAGCAVSCDLNYRSRLWSMEQAAKTMEKLMPYVDVCIANREDDADIFGITAPGDPVEGCKEIARRLTERFGFGLVAMTMLDAPSASQNRWSALLWRDGSWVCSRRYDTQVIERMGIGDAFAAGLIYALLDGQEDQRAIDFAVAASLLKFTVPGDANLVSAAEAERIAAGGAGGVQR